MLNSAGIISILLPAEVEIISDKNIKDSLLLKDGDIVEVEIYLQPDGF